MATFNNSTNKFSVAKWIVSPTPGHGTHTTIASAITAASSGDTIALQAATYTENITLKDGVTIKGIGNAVINGKISASGAIASNVFDVVITTNGDYAIELTGASATVATFLGCTIVGTNTIINYTTSNAGSVLVVEDCDLYLGTTGIAHFTMSSTGTINFYETILSNPGGSSTASTASAGVLAFYFNLIAAPITTSGTAQIYLTNSEFRLNNIQCLTVGDSTESFATYTTFVSGTASAISISAGCILNARNCVVQSSNTNAITGAGTLKYTPIYFTGSSSNVNTTTQTILNFGPSATMGSSNSGNTNTLTVTNSSNTATSAANIVSTVGGGTAADATYQAAVSGVTTWTWGVDNSDSDAYALAASAALGTTNVMRVATTGEINYPLQSSFLAYVANTITNVTGNLFTAYTIIFDTEVYDQNADFNLGTSVFTAPVTGRYCFHGTCTLGGSTIMSHNRLTIVTSNRSYETLNVKPANAFDLGCAISHIVDMDIGDTATLQVAAFGEAANTDDVLGAANPSCAFSGQLLA